MNPVPEPIDGVLVVNKIAGPSSHDVVLHVRRLLRVRVGHTGTLDPAASGVLPLVLGKATRLSRFFLTSDKVYEATIQLGKATSTYDTEGETTSEGTVPSLSDLEIEDLLAGFRGEILQTPPMFSAVKVSGERLYRLARRRITIDRPQRHVRIHSLEILEKSPAQWKLRVVCSAGTYIRTLAHDIGSTLGCGAFLAALTRTRSGQFRLESSIPVDQLDGPKWRDCLVPMEELLPEMPLLEPTEEQVCRVRHGGQLNWSDLDTVQLPVSSAFRVFSQGRLVALVEKSGDLLKPLIVLSPID